VEEKVDVELLKARVFTLEMLMDHALFRLSDVRYLLEETLEMMKKKKLLVKVLGHGEVYRNLELALEVLDEAREILIKR